MTALALLVLISAFLGASDASWCICRSELNSSALQKTLDYACGAGAECSPIHQNGACYNPNTVLAHCSYAANSYFQRKGQATGSCDFSGTATVTTTDPSYSGCSYPSTASSAAANGTSTPGSATFNSAVGPATSTDGSGAGGLPVAGTATLCLAIILPALVLSRLS
ncbi:hypothetical protein Taro_003019 [Colocasia esculenta]|uniref:X8 domain-containing protein n=1 Tax=Colocasia esculenta TaxID=4460 RepID=A0A843TIM4_COLES|nr:hypothetical protein [Colocasia esculenta]